MIVSPLVEFESIGRGRFQTINHLRPIAYDLGGGRLARIAPAWVDGDANHPHRVDAAPLWAAVAGDGLRRIYPTRDPARYFEFGAPYIKPAATWQKVSLGAPVRSGNRLTWTTANANVYIEFGGHLVKLAILLKGGWQPPGGQFAFPVSLSGLTRQGGTLLADGVPVMQMAAPAVYDLDDPLVRRPITTQFVTVDGQVYALFTLPSLAGLGRPLVDPTLTLQPDETAGKDNNFYGGSPTTNYGTIAEWDAIMDGGGAIRRGIVQFDLSSIPGNATITSSIFTLTGRGSMGSSPLMALHRVTRDWTEAGSTWNTYDGSNNWTTAGGDYDATADATMTPGSQGAGVQHAFTVTALAQEWIGGTANYGFIVKVDSESGTNKGIIGHSSNAVTDTNRPKLVTQYTVPQARSLALLGVG